ncbi:hypothetical protein HKX48_009100 [Thoreauomyces humboldtii]|nr:hypothetical protein HKX48_009100 [Thoreauomyces humboldtii]
MLTQSAPSLPATASDASPTIQLSRKERRALLAKAAAVAAAGGAEDIPGAPSKGESPSASRRPSVSFDAATVDQAAEAAEPSSLPAISEKVGSAYQETFSKKLRTLRKKLTKLEKYEEKEYITLNADQRQALEKKPETVASVRELEEVAKQIAVVEDEEHKANFSKLRAAEQDATARIARAVENVNTKNAAATRETLQLFYVLNFLLPTIASTSTVALSEQEYNALFYFRAVLTGAGLQQVPMYGNDAIHRSGDSFIDAVTYAQLSDAVKTVLNPPAPPKFGGDLEQTEEASPVKDEEQMQEHSTSFFSAPIGTEEPEEIKETHVDAEESPVAAPAPTFGSISFFNKSEVLDIETDRAENTERTDETINATVVSEAAPVESVDQEEIVVPAVIGNAADVKAAPQRQNQGQQPQDKDKATRPKGPYRGRGRGGYRGGRGRGAARGGAAAGAPGGARPAAPAQ